MHNNAVNSTGFARANLVGQPQDFFQARLDAMIARSLGVGKSLNLLASLNFAGATFYFLNLRSACDMCKAASNIRPDPADIAAGKGG
jgi:hypothetical protein